MKKQIGLYFGTFNPIHVGHVIIAQYMLEFTELDEVWFVVTPHNPFKKKSTLLDDYTRLELVRRAVEQNDRLRVSDIEFGLPKPSYTIDTLAYLGEKYPDYDFALIMGSDNIATLHKWKNGDVILERHSIYVYPRYGTEKAEDFSHPHIHFTEAPIIQLSSSFIRSAIAEGKNVSGMLPGSVWEEIERNGYYFG